MPDPVASAYTFADVAKPIPVTRGRSVSTRMDITLWRSKEKVSGQRWSRADLDERDPNIMIYISRWYTIDETSSKSILGQACSAIRAKQVVTMGPEGLKAAAAKAKKTLGEKGRKAVRAKAIVTLGKAGLRAIAAKRKQTLGPKGLKAAAAKAKNTLGEKGRKAVRAKQIVTMGVKGLKAARAKQVKTMGSEGCKAATAKAKKTLGKEGRKAARAKQAESMGEAGRRAAGLVHRATLTGNRPSRLGELASLTKQDIDKWLEYMENIRAGRNNKQFISLCRATINNLRREMLARDGKAPLPNDPSSFVYWPPALPYKPVSYTVDEIEHVGAWIVAGKLKVKEDSEGVEVAENA